MVLLLLLAGAYVAPLDCPGEDAFFAAVAKRSETSTVGLAVEIKDRGEQLIGTLTLDGTTRVVEASGCVELVDALALVASLLLETTATPEPIEPEPELAGPIAFTGSARMSISSARGTSAWSMGALGAATAGIVPGVGFGVPIFVQLDGAAGTVRATASWTQAKAAPIVEGETVGGARFTQLSGRLEGCPSPWAMGAGFGLAGCAAVESGVLWAVAEGVPGAQSVAQPWISGGALARLAYFGLDPFFIEAEAGALVPFVRPRFVFDPGLVVHDVAPITGFVAAGGGVRFW